MDPEVFLSYGWVSGSKSLDGIEISFLQDKISSGWILVKILLSENFMFREDFRKWQQFLLENMINPKFISFLLENFEI